jgi:sarcosine oxidase subunit alpha
MLSGGARRLAALYAVRPGERAVIATVDDRGLDDALALRAAGVEVVAVADLREDAGAGPAAAGVEAAGIRLLTGSTVVRARGRNRVEHAIVARVDERGRARERGETFACDLLAVSGGSAPALSLLLQAGARAGYDSRTGTFVLDELPPGLHAAGAVCGHADAETAERSGARAGGDAATTLTQAVDARRKVERGPARRTAAPPPFASDGRRGGRAFVDLDEDVTVKDIVRATAEGYDSLELSKRYTTVTMGPSQGRFSQVPAARVLASLTGLDMAGVGLTTARPPWTSVPMGVLAGRPFEPAKRSAIHGRHEERGATVRWAGDWERPYDYGDPAGEALAVHETAGLIDVSTLGKLLVRGPDAAELLDRLYPNRISDLAPGRIRYGVIVSEAGRITDDGTVCRIDEETFYVTTTSAGAAAVESSFTWWLETWGLDAQVTDLTQGVGAMNLAGPRARDILVGLTDLDCSSEAFAYLDARHAVVGAVPCLLLRIGFVGELGYELHCSSVHAEHLWNAITSVGAEFGLRPFGLEPQRVLRLQKQHIIVGQDTDSESTPFGVGMDWIVRLDKPQPFIGRWALEQDCKRQPGLRLVGFTTDGELPTEGAVVLGEDGRPAGQVTSARRSPQLGRAIGMATVPAALAVTGGAIEISDVERRIAATVTLEPFYDPRGEALRS